MLDWQDDYVVQRVAKTAHGTYRIGNAGNLGLKVVTFTDQDGDHFIGGCVHSDDGVVIAEKHAARIVGPCGSEAQS